MKINLVNGENFPIGGFDTNAIDLSDVRQLPSDFSNPLAPANAMLHEFTEQWWKQIGGKTNYEAAHSVAIDAENMANSERYAHGTAPVRPHGYDIPGYFGETGMLQSLTIRYDATYPEGGGTSQAQVKVFYGIFHAEIEWR